MVAFLLKILNLLVYIVPVASALVLHRRGGGMKKVWWDLPDETRFSFLLIGAYCIAYLAVHGMATTILRMVYPIAVFPVIVSIGAAAVSWKAVASQRLGFGATVESGEAAALGGRAFPNRERS